MSQAAHPTVAWKIGRYDVVGHLASGGMAEILLGRILGPSGFQRPVVIKRILPHLAREKGFVEMFLDEARIVAGIRHPNVVQVHELGHENGELFLVMEYLEGESMSGVARRLRSHGQQIDYAMAAYIVAEACGGLHAAHDLADPQGNKQNVVHRDVSPQNVFVSYNGAVKVLDFGIAVAADRVTRTEAGMFKGKFEYSSPEQCRGRPLDRRSDVFALGILLWELSIGMRLFKRGGQLETLRAICEEPIPSPTEVQPEYPEILAQVAMKALQRKREDRYQTAADMRRDLLAVVRKLAPDAEPMERLAALMHQIFVDRMAEKREMLRRVESGSKVGALPTVETDTSVELPVAFQTNGSTAPPGEMGGMGPSIPVVTTSGAVRIIRPPTTSPTTSPGTEAHGVLTEGSLQVAHPANKSLGTVVAIGLACSVALGVMGIWLAARSTSARAHLASPAASVTMAAPLPLDPSLAPAPVIAAAAQAPADVVVRIETTPSKAHVFVKGEDKGLSPIDVRLPKNGTAVDLEVRRDGYQTLRDKVVPDVDQKLRLPLVATPAPAAPPAAKPPSGGGYHRFD